MKSVLQPRQCLVSNFCRTILRYTNQCSICCFTLVQWIECVRSHSKIPFIIPMKVPLISHNLEKWLKMIIEIQYKLNKWVVILVFFNFVKLHLPLIFLFQQFLATQLIMQTSESGISAKSLRGRESTRKQDAAEKVSQKYLWRAWTITAICVEPQDLCCYFPKKLCN